MRRLTSGFTALAAVAALLLSGCAGLPRDPNGTLDRIRSSQILRVGASPSEGLLAVADGDVTGPEADLVESFAQAQGARVEWHPGGETDLVHELAHGRLDLVVGGLTADSPWTEEVALTRPWSSSQRDGATVERVLAAQRGENALLVALETHLDGRRS